MGKTVYDLYKVKIIFSFKKNLRIRSPLSQASERFKTNLFADFRVTGQICPAIKERGNIKT